MTEDDVDLHHLCYDGAIGEGVANGCEPRGEGAKGLGGQLTASGNHMDIDVDIEE